MDKLLTPAQAATWLHENGKTSAKVHPETVKNWLRSGKLEGCRVAGSGPGGGPWRTKVVWLQAFLPATPKGRRGRPKVPRCFTCLRPARCLKCGGPPDHHKDCGQHACNKCHPVLIEESCPTCLGMDLQECPAKEVRGEREN